MKKWLRQNRRLYKYYYIKWPFLTLMYLSVALGSAAVQFVAAASVFVAADAAFLAAHAAFPAAAAATAAGLVPCFEC